MNPILNTDSYKFGHFAQYREDTRTIVSHIAPRWSKQFPEIKEVVFLGFNAWMDDYMNGRWKISKEHVDEAEEISKLHGVNFNREGWDYIVEAYDGWLPIEIFALPEGTAVPLGTPVLQVFNTDPKLPWLTSFVETDLLRAIWYPSTVASISRGIRKLLLRADREWTAKGYKSFKEQIPFMLHDFGARGATCAEAAAIGGMAHLTQFSGTDNLLAIEKIRKLYGVPCAGYSVEAAEHSTVTSWGEENEVEMYRKMITSAKPGQIISIVSDSYDLDYAVRKIFGSILKDDILALGERGGKLVVRPDSGDPVFTPINVVQTLAHTFGGLDTNGLLPPYLGVLQGDGISYDTIKEILKHAILKGINPGNFVFGMGGGLLQKLDRDTFGFAMKGNAVFRAGGNTFEPFGKKAPGKVSIQGLIRVRPGFGVETIEHGGQLWSNNLMKSTSALVYPDDYENDKWEYVVDRARFISVLDQ